MLYQSTRGQAPAVTASAAVVGGIAPDGGLYVPAALPVFKPGELIELAGLPYAARAYRIMARFFDDFSPGELAKIVDRAWGGRTRFDVAGVAPLKNAAGVHFLELWHGPTSAFKDVALQFLPGVMDAARRKLGIAEKTLILVATSGDTGKAALEGFRDVPGTHCAVFYPEGGVSAVQRLQMETQRGGNVSVIAVKGNFDDAQTGVKKLFADSAFGADLKQKGWALSSANSINWGRLAPQIVYYVSAWCDLFSSGRIGQDEEVDFVVPTGNFGNILAGWYARAMGLPVGRLLCASNKNRVLADFFMTGRYDMNRPFYQTISPSMDILLSSNLERLLFELSSRDSAWVASAMAELRTGGCYEVSPAFRAEAGKVFRSGSADDDETKAAILQVYQSAGYLMDPHTAVAWKVLQEAGVERETVIVSTASPYKFAADVLHAITGESESGLAAVERLSARTGAAVPEALSELAGLPERHNRVCEVSAMGEALLQALGG